MPYSRHTQGFYVQDTTQNLNPNSQVLLNQYRKIQLKTERGITTPATLAESTQQQESEGVHKLNWVSFARTSQHAVYAQ